MEEIKLKKVIMSESLMSDIHAQLKLIYRLNDVGCKYYLFTPNAYGDKIFSGMFWMKCEPQRFEYSHVYNIATKIVEETV